MNKATRKTLSLIRAKLRNLGSGDRGGFFVQYDYRHLMPENVSPYPAIERLFAAGDFCDIIDEIAKHRSDFERLGEQPGDPTLGMGMFSPLDGMAAYAVVKKFHPKKIIEIGSGNSTRFLAKAGGDAQITCIDPAPRRDIDDLGVKFIRRVLDENDVSLIAGLDADDILFIDSSHIMQPGMDVDIQFNRFFPELKPGVIVHVHDIFLPDPYPSEWKTRNWNEQNALFGWIASGYFETIYPGAYMATRHADYIDQTLSDFAPLATMAAGSIWLRRAG